MNTVEILNQVETLLKDASYTREQLLQSVNKGLLEVAWSVYLPKLQAKDTVTATAGSLSEALPDDFHHGLYRARNITKGRTCTVFYNRLSMEDWYDGGGQEGDVEAVVDEGGDTLHFRLSPPEDQTLELQYYTRPTALADEASSTPSCLPEAFHHKILVNFAAWDIYSQLEDDIEEPRRNTKFYQSEYLAGVSGLKAALPDTSRPRRKIPRRRIWY